MTREHLCNDECKCPHCGGALYYSEKYKQHACVNKACMWIEAYDGEGKLKVDKEIKPLWWNRQTHRS